MIRVGFCPPTHLGEIMDLIGSDLKDLIGVVGPSILTEIRAMPAKAPSAMTVTWRGMQPAVCAPACWAPQNTVFFYWAFPEGRSAQGQWEKLSHAALKLQLLSLLKPVSVGRQGPPSPQVEASRDTCPSTCSRVALSAWACEEKWEHLLSGLQTSWSYPRLWLKSTVSGFINLGGGWLRHGHEAVFV